MTPLHVLTAAAGWLYGFLCLYILIMGFYRCYLAGTLNPFLKVMGAPILLIGAAVDVASNLTLAWVIFLEHPREWLVTTRLKRYLAGPDGWRKEAASWTCARVLNPFDPRGRHC